MTRPLNKREQNKLIRKASEVKNKRISKILFWGCILSFIFILYSVSQYYWTIIDYKIPLIIFVFSGVLFGALIKKIILSTSKEFKLETPIFLVAFSIGSIVTSLFFLVNNLFSHTAVYSIKAPIIEVHKQYSQKGRHLYAEIELLEFTKYIKFSNDYEETIDNYNFVLLGVSKGGLGFEVIRDRTLVK